MTHPSPSSLAQLVRTGALSSLALCAFLFVPADARDSKPDNLVPAGAPVDCIQLQNIRSSHVKDDRTIDFEMNGRKIYRNTLPYSCPGLKSEEKFAYKTSLSQLCSVDIITVLQSFGGGLSQGASCGLGKFQPMEKAK
ncbi:hypothetical protein [Sphingobium subterraneum]|uniref:Secreted protein n=1 Tax=Sphingobium subterraneum TaxID=627688 RepID=A0A841J1A5_9SPHN|nr:hypothetical protein [Sphingobium subterraneum]MBB6122308.1 hypothetical protein [Sphingobium subterraneum]